MILHVLVARINDSVVETPSLCMVPCVFFFFCQMRGIQVDPFTDSSDKVTILTHCNTGSLATGGYGTALGVVRALHEKGRLEMVYFTETRQVFGHRGILI